MNADPQAGVTCANCGWDGIAAQLGRQLIDVHRLWERIEPGETVPAGECPECGALAQLKELAPKHVATRACGCRMEWDGGMITDHPCGTHAAAPQLLAAVEAFES